MELIIEVSGVVRTVYDETVPLHVLGPLEIRRASHVEPDAQGKWIADLSPLQGPRLGPYVKRSEALAAELQWIYRNWLLAKPE